HSPVRGDRPHQDRLADPSGLIQVLGQEIPRQVLPVLPGRNLAVIAEAAVRNFMLRMKGYDATEQFIKRHGRILRNES
ncbi:MAG: HPr kinase/phosphorylase, partial [Gammaproteobacteria bacterium]|nr:HPr kinase/phosphorylase [Gammaproteobacteria bacterium]